jgi:hypothetical protein
MLASIEASRVRRQPDLPRPRHLDSPGYLEKRDRIFRVMGMSLRVGETVAA